MCELPQDPESILEADYQPRQAMDSGPTRDTRRVYLWRQEGYCPGFRSSAAWVQQSAWKGQTTRYSDRCEGTICEQGG